MTSTQPPDDFIDEVVENYIQDQIAAAEIDGQSQAEIEKSFDAGSLILCVKMLAKWGGNHLPEGSELLSALAELIGGSEAECRLLCKSFIQAGWMDAGYCLTDRGRQLAGIHQE